MGKKGKGWFATFKKIFKSASKDSSHNKKENVKICTSAASKISSVKYNPGENTSDYSSIEDKSGLQSSSSQNNAIAIAAATATAAEAAMVAAKAAIQAVQLAGYHGLHSLELFQERAAIFIQSHYRGYLGRRALRGLKGVVKLQALVRGHNVRKQTHLAMSCMHALVRVGPRDRNLLAHHPLYNGDDYESSCSSEDHNHWNFINSRHDKSKILLGSPSHNKHHHIISREHALPFAYFLQRDKVDEEEQNEKEKATLDSYINQVKVNVNRMTCGNNNWLDSWMTSASTPQPHLVGTTSYSTSPDDISDSERTVEVNSLDISHSHRPGRKPRQNSFDGTPSYMTPTQSAKAKVRPTSPAQIKRRAQSFSPCNNPYSSSGRTSPFRGPTGCDSSSSGGGGTTPFQNYLRCPSPNRNRVVA